MLTDDDIDRICDDFENAWLAGQTPDLGNLLSQVPKEDQRQLCKAIIPLDIEYRIKAGQQPSLEDYANFGEQAEDVALRELQPKISPTVLPHSTSNATPRQIGPYKLLQILGEGGMGAVWMAEQEKPVRRRVALKLIKSGVDHKQIVARFEAERQAIALMDHPNIAKVLDAGTTEEGFPYFVMELVMGKPFNEYCDANQLTIDQRLELFIPVCNAVQHAHQKGIIHRDLKPNNILIALYDGRPVPKVIDFGLAKALQTQEKLTDKTLFTEFGLILGTIQYMSPEQAELNQIDIDTRTDIYSLGVILYELLTGTTPLDRDSIRGHAMLKVLEWVRQNEPPRPSARLSSTSEKAASGISHQRQLELKKLKSMMQGELDWIVMKAIDKDRNRRYATANSFADDITSYLKNEVVVARPPSKLYIAQKFVAKHRRIVLTGCSIVSLLVLGLLGTGIMWYRATKSDEKAQQSKREAEQLAIKESAAADAAKEAREKSIRLASDLQKRAKEASKTLLEFGESEYAAGHFSSAREKLETAWRLRADDDPQKRAYGLTLANRASLGGKCTAILHHEKTVRHVAFSPDGTRIATVSDDTARIWDAFSGVPIGQSMKHTGYIKSMVFSPDGSRIATASNDGTSRLWEAATGMSIGQPMTHESAVKDVVFSPNGNCFATVSEGDTAQLWDSSSGAAVGHPMKHADTVNRLIFSPDGSLVATTSLDTTARLWAAADGTPVGQVMKHDAAVYNVVFSQDGTRVATASSDNTARVWEAATGVSIARPIYHDNAVWEVLFNADRSRVITQSVDSTLQIWDAVSGAPVGHSIHAHPLSTLISPDRNRIAAEDIGGKAVQIWDTSDGAGVGKPIDHSESGGVGSFSPDGTRLAILSNNKTCRLWDSATGTPIGKPMEHDFSVSKVVFSPDGTRIASASETTVSIWEDATNQDSIGQPMHQIYPVVYLTFSPDGARVGTASSNKTTQIWDASTGAQIGLPVRFDSDSEWDLSVWNRIFSMHETNVDNTLSFFRLTALWEEKTDAFDEQPNLYSRSDRKSGWKPVFSPNKTKVITASNDDTIQLRNAETGVPIGQPIRQVSSDGKVAFSPNGSRFTTASTDNIARIWEAETGTLACQPLRHDYELFYVLFSPDGTRVATVSADYTRLWDAETGSPIGQPLKHVGRFPIVFSPEGNRIATATNDKTVGLWDSVNSDPVGMEMEHRDDVNLIVFSPDGTRVATGSDDETARLWDAYSGASIGEPMRHEGSVTSVAFSPDGTRVATGSDDETARLWDAYSGASIGEPMRHEGSVTSVAFSPDGTRVATGSGRAGTVRLWDGETISPNSIEAFLNRFAKEYDPSIPRDIEYDAAVEALRTKRLLRYRKSTVAKAIQDENWFAAAYHLPALIEEEPNEAKWQVMWESLQLHLNAEKGAWNEASRHAQLRLELEPSVKAFDEYLLCSLATNDSVKIKSIVSQYFSFAEASADPVDWDIGWISSLYNDESTPWEGISRLAAKAVESSPKSSAYSETLGGTLYRLTRFDEAKVALNRSLELATEKDKEAKQTTPDVSPAPGTTESADVPNESPVVGTFYVHAFLAMTYHQLNEPEQSSEHRAQMARIELEHPANEWQERLRRKLLADEVVRTCLSIP